MANKLSLPVAAALLFIIPAIASAASLQWEGSGSLTNWDVGVSSGWLQNGGSSVFANGDDVSFNDAALSFAPFVSGTVQPNSITINATNDYTFAGSGGIAGPAGLFKQGPGTLLIRNANTFTGDVTVADGVLRYGNAGALGTTPGSIVYVTNNGTVDLNSLNVQPRTF